jgi:hypothetical protein
MLCGMRKQAFRDDFLSALKGVRVEEDWSVGNPYIDVAFSCDRIVYSLAQSTGYYLYRVL